MPRRPAKKNVAFEKAELKVMAAVNHDMAAWAGVKVPWEICGRWASCQCLVATGDHIGHNDRLSQSPGCRDESSVLFGQAGNQDDQTCHAWQHPPELDAGLGDPFEKSSRASMHPKKISPVGVGRDDRNRCEHGQHLTQEITAAENGDDVSWQSVKKFGHGKHHSTARIPSHEFLLERVLLLALDPNFALNSQTLRD
jgi:hypothetical protein